MSQSSPLTVDFWQEVQQIDGIKSKGSLLLKQILEIMHLVVPKHDVLVIILNNSDQCFILSDYYIYQIT